MNKELQELDKLFKESKWNQVVKKTKNLINTGEDIAVYYNLLGLSLSKLDKNQDAEKFFIDGINKFPNEVSLRSNIALIQIKLKKLDKAEQNLNEAIKINSEDIYTLFAIGKLKREQQQYEEAAKVLKKVCEKDVKFADALTLLGQTYLDLGHLTNKKEFYELAEKNLLIHSKLFPLIGGTDYVLSTFTDYALNDFHQKIMLNKIKNLNFNDFHKSFINFAIGKSFEDQKKYAQSVEFIKIANETKDKSVDKNIIKNEILKFKNVKKIFDNYNLKISNTSDLFQKKMIFIVGLPRSGTTLVHQLLSSVEDTYGFGESIFLDIFFREKIFNKEFLSNLLNKKTMNNQIINISNEIGQKYSSQSNKNIFIDKMPPNFYWIGFIKLLFPNSKVIHISRNVKDNCLSLYKNTFGGKDLDWSYNETNILRYVINYRNVMKYWKKKYGEFIYDLKYDDLVKNKSEVTRKLFDFCNMKWDENIFNFYKSAKPIKTVSLYQVKKPIYDNSVNSSKNYSNYFDFLNKLDDL
tara:strand:- start:3632 stop:5197 length:1566 start_codon:yes stop_codon:yes gene_type:complete